MRTKKSANVIEQMEQMLKWKSKTMFAVSVFAGETVKTQKTAPIGVRFCVTASSASAYFTPIVCKD